MLMWRGSHIVKYCINLLCRNEAEQQTDSTSVATMLLEKRQEEKRVDRDLNAQKEVVVEKYLQYIYLELEIVVGVLVYICCMMSGA